MTNPSTKRKKEKMGRMNKKKRADVMERNSDGNTRSRQTTQVRKSPDTWPWGGIAENWGKRCFKKLTTALFPSLPQATLVDWWGWFLLESVLTWRWA